MPRLEALVVFEDRPDSFWLRLLRPGFRHCFCLLRQPSGWLLLDSRSGGFEARQAPSCSVDSLVRAFTGLGARVIGMARTPVPDRCLPPAPFTCVELVKRAIGVHDPTVLSPFQLYRTLSADPRRLLVAEPASATG